MGGIRVIEGGKRKKGGAGGIVDSIGAPITQKVSKEERISPYVAVPNSLSPLSTSPSNHPPFSILTCSRSTQLLGTDRGIGPLRGSSGTLGFRSSSRRRSFAGMIVGTGVGGSKLLGNGLE